MHAILLQFLCGTGFVFIGCWFYLKPSIVFGFTDSPITDKFVRAWALVAMSIGFFASQ